MKKLFQAPVIGLIALVLSSGTYLCMKWKEPVAIFMAPPFLFFLLMLVVVLRVRLQRRRGDATALHPTKAGHVS